MFNVIKEAIGNAVFDMYLQATTDLVRFVTGYTISSDGSSVQGITGSDITLEFYSDDVLLGSGVSDESGNFTFTLSPTLNVGESYKILLFDSQGEPITDTTYPTLSLEWEYDNYWSGSLTVVYI